MRRKITWVEEYKRTCACVLYEIESGDWKLKNGGSVGNAGKAECAC